MASKYSKTMKLDISGTLSIDDNGNITVDVEELGQMNLADVLSDFNNQEMKLSVAQKDEFQEVLLSTNQNFYKNNLTYSMND